MGTVPTEGSVESDYVCISITIIRLGALEAYNYELGIRDAKNILKYCSKCVLSANIQK